MQEQSTDMTSWCRYDVTMPVPRVCVTAQVNSGDVTMLGQRRLSLATMTKWAMADCVLNKIKYGLPWITTFDHSWSDSPMIFIRDCITRENHCWIAPHSWPNCYSRWAIHYIHIYLVPDEINDNNIMVIDIVILSCSFKIHQMACL